MKFRNLARFVCTIHINRDDIKTARINQLRQGLCVSGWVETYLNFDIYRDDVYDGIRYTKFKHDVQLAIYTRGILKLKIMYDTELQFITMYSRYLNGSLYGHCYYKTSHCRDGPDTYYFPYHGYGIYHSTYGTPYKLVNGKFVRKPRLPEVKYYP